MALQSNLIWTVRQLAVLLEQYGKARMEALDLSPTQGIVLQYLLGHREREIYGVELHETLGLSKSSVSATLKALRQKGYLRMREDPKDNRKNRSSSRNRRTAPGCSCRSACFPSRNGCATASRSRGLRSSRRIWTGCSAM